jgi:hypothetical protein
MPHLRRGLTESEYRKALREGRIEHYPKKGRMSEEERRRRAAVYRERGGWNAYNRAYNKARRLGLPDPAAHARAAMQEARDA